MQRFDIPGPTVGTLAVLALAAPLLGGCSSTKQSVGINKVDDLVTRIEKVHLEAELAKQAIYDSVIELRSVVVPSAEDPFLAFEAYVEALDASDDRAESFADSLAPMKRSASQVFARWQADLASFKSEALRDRSRQRLMETRERYEAVLASAEASREGYEALNSGLRDLALYLSHDFNPSAVQSIAGEANSLRDQAQQLGARLDVCIRAGEEYVRVAAPLGPLQPTAQPTGKARRKGSGATANDVDSSSGAR